MVNFNLHILRLKCFYLFFFFFSFQSYLSADFEDFDDEEFENFEEEEERIFFHKGLECCSCFIHCRCFGHYLGIDWEGFPNDKPNHPCTPIDKMWHEFMKGILTAKKEGPFFVLGRNVFTHFVGYRYDYCDGDNIHSLSDYLDLVKRFRNWIEEARLNNMDKYRNYWYPSPHERGKLEENLSRIENEYLTAIRILDDVPAKLISLYQQVIKDCPHDYSFSIYNRGIINSLEGEWDKAVVEMQKLIETHERERINLLDSKVYQLCGECCLEVNLFHEAVIALTKAIEKNPENKQAYFYRASAYFETGNFDQAIQDYLLSDKQNNLSNLAPVSHDFMPALMSSLCRGTAEAAVDFIPSLCSSAYGLGQALWVSAQHPVQSMEDFAKASYNMGQCIASYCKDLDWETMEGYVEQIKVLYERFDRLTEKEKGELIGYTIGRYGTDIFIGSGAIKGVAAYRDLKNANRLCNLEAMVISKANKEAIAASSLKHAAERDAYFKTVKYNFDSHNKHVLGHNDYKNNNSIWTHPDPESLLRKFGGKGNRRRGSMGEPGYKETVDFEEIIGIWKNEQGTIALPTTKGTIHYGKKGAHIVPSGPDAIIK